MTIFATGKNTFAIGKKGQTAKYVVRQKGKKITGVRGVRPKLDDRFKATKASKAVVEALKAGL